MLSGKFVLRLEPELHKALKKEASEAGESLNSLCARKLKSGAIGAIADLPILQIVKKFEPLGIVLFGSVARGEATAKSDLDLLIVLQPEEGVQRKHYHLWDSLKLDDKISPQFVNPPKDTEAVGSLWLENAIEGEVLYDPMGVVREMLRRIRVEISQGQYLKKLSHGQGYWIRKGEDAK